MTDREAERVSDAYLKVLIHDDRVSVRQMARELIELRKLVPYVQHKRSCVMSVTSAKELVPESVIECTCGLDQLGTEGGA